jgi:hypothetical protein
MFDIETIRTIIAATQPFDDPDTPQRSLEEQRYTAQSKKPSRSPRLGGRSIVKPAAQVNSTISRDMKEIEVPELSFTKDDLGASVDRDLPDDLTVTVGVPGEKDVTLLANSEGFGEGMRMNSPASTGSSRGGGHYEQFSTVAENIQQRKPSTNEDNLLPNSRTVPTPKLRSRRSLPELTSSSLITEVSGNSKC